MKYVSRVCFLVLIWCGFSANIGLLNILLGLLLSILCCLLLDSKEEGSYRIRVLPLFWLLAFTLIELVKSSLLVAWDVMTPKQRSHPKIINLELACRNDIERTLLGSLISLTPGTLTIGLSEDKSHLIIHVMFAGDPSGVIHYIKNRLEPKVLRVFKYGNS